MFDKKFIGLSFNFSDDIRYIFLAQKVVAFLLNYWHKSDIILLSLDFKPFNNLIFS
jgi:hypothetical protein